MNKDNEIKACEESCGTLAMLDFTSNGEAALLHLAKPGDLATLSVDQVNTLGDFAHYIIPRTYETEYADDPQAWLCCRHESGAAWYITELDIGEHGDRARTLGPQHQAFGLADLFGDGGELGYISLPEIFAAGATIDLTFEPRSIAELRANLKAGSPAS